MRDCKRRSDECQGIATLQVSLDLDHLMAGTKTVETEVCEECYFDILDDASCYGIEVTRDDTKPLNT